MVAYTVHRATDTHAQVSGATLPGGKPIPGALVPALEVELVTDDGLNSSVILRFVGEDIPAAKALYVAGAGIVGNFAAA